MESKKRPVAGSMISMESLGLIEQHSIQFPRLLRLFVLGEVLESTRQILELW